MSNSQPKDSKKQSPFGLAWLDSSYLETLLPGTPWQSISDILSSPIAEVAKQQFHNEHRKQMLIELLGVYFKRSYLTDEKDYPKLIEPPSLTEDQIQKLENEAKSWLQIQINDIAFAKQCAIQEDQSEKDFCPEMKDFLEQLYQIITTSMDRHLYLKLSKSNKLSHAHAQSDENENDAKNHPRSIQRYSAKNNLKLVFKNKGKQMAPIQEKTAKHQFVGELSSEYSELISESLLYILRKDPRRTSFLIHKLSGKQLTNSLRHFIWSDILLRNERKKDNSPMDIELIARKNFASGVLRGRNELKVKDPTVTPISGLIETSVVETYSKISALSYWLEENHLRQTMKILNVMYTYSKDYEPYYIFWLLPFQITFKNDNQKSELIYDLAMYLDLYKKNCFSSWTEVFTIAGKVCTDLAHSDNEFYEHLIFISKKNSKVNQKDFITELIYNEGKKAGNFPNENDGGAFQKVNRDLLSDPIIFLRKWIGEGFASILNPNALLFVWDQLFMSLWSSKQLEIITKIILYLLRDKFIRASDYDQMRKVFLEEPCKLYTVDIQKAYFHLMNGGYEEDIIKLKSVNNDIVRSSNNDGSAVVDKNNDDYKKYININESRLNNLETICIRYLHATLVVSKNSISAELDPTRLNILTTIYYGNLEVAQRSIENIGVVMDVKSSIHETKLYEVGLTAETIIFDLSNFLSEINSSENKEVFMIILVRYQTITYHHLDLGYCKMLIYKKSDNTEQNKTNNNNPSTSRLEIPHGKIKRLLHSGSPPINNLTEIPDLPQNSYKDRLGPNSFITFNMVNPHGSTLISSRLEKN